MFEMSEEEIKAARVVKEAPPALVPEAEIERLIKGIKEYVPAFNNDTTKLSTIAIAIAIILQRGGTARGASANIYAKVDEKVLSLSDLRKVIQKINWKYTLRQLARTKATFIKTVASHHEIPGDLAQKMKRNHPNLSLEESFWMSNFQMDNPECPSNVRELLIQHYKEKFGDNAI